MSSLEWNDYPKLCGISERKCICRSNRPHLLIQRDSNVKFGATNSAPFLSCQYCQAFERLLTNELTPFTTLLNNIMRLLQNSRQCIQIGAIYRHPRGFGLLGEVTPDNRGTTQAEAEVVPLSVSFDLVLANFVHKRLSSSKCPIFIQVESYVSQLSCWLASTPVCLVVHWRVILMACILSILAEDRLVINILKRKQDKIIVKMKHLSQNDQSAMFCTSNNTYFDFIYE